VPIKNTTFFKEVKAVLLVRDFLLRPEQFFMVLWNIFIIIALTMNIFYVALRLSIFINADGPFPSDQ
jgi:hypothetical protein